MVSRCRKAGFVCHRTFSSLIKLISLNPFIYRCALAEDLAGAMPTCIQPGWRGELAGNIRRPMFSMALKRANTVPHVDIGFPMTRLGRRFSFAENIFHA